jgi:hypothetical protein
MDSLDRLRLQIADRRRLVLHEIVGWGDGLALAFQTRGAPVVEGSVSVAVISDSLTTVLYDGPDWTFDYALGFLRLENPPDAGDRVQVSYQWSSFSDVELETLLTEAGGDVAAAAILALQMVLADGDRFIKYTLGQETVDRGAARQAVVNLLDEMRGHQAGLVGLVHADSDYRRCLMAPYLEQTCDD